MAERLITAFGSLAGFLAASPEAIDRALGDDAWVGRAVLASRALIESGQRETIRSGRVDSHAPELRRYLAGLLSGLRHEELHVVFADRAGYYIADERMALGGARSLSLSFRALFHRSFELGAGGLLLAHGHPSGDLRPSREDIAATRALARMAAALDVALIDHFIVANGTVTSMREGGLL